ncbi:hypothetical protein AOLI_G00145780 [Acnodon oligacanthus]
MPTETETPNRSNNKRDEITMFFLRTPRPAVSFPPRTMPLLSVQKANLIRSCTGRPLAYGPRQPDLVREEDPRLHSGLNDPTYSLALCEEEQES